ncbi:MAG: rhodanese-like domain-containing protein [Desulfobacterales bacterium]|nr:rhodanese-like domain-containing protein [Desulfobacterales bacterium]
MKDIARELIILLCLVIITAFTVNHFSPGGIAPFGQWDTSQGVITAKPKDHIISHELEIENILMAKEIYDSGNAVFVDARSKEIFNEGHIKGAISLGVDQFYELIDGFITEVPISALIVVYCSGRECEEAHDLAQCLLDEGYTNIAVFIDGYDGWEEKGYPID